MRTHTHTHTCKRAAARKRTRKRPPPAPAGLASLGTADEEVYDDLKNVLYTDSAVAGEAAGLGMGLLMAGSGTEKTQEMLAYAHDTQHEKIIRGG